MKLIFKILLLILLPTYTYSQISPLYLEPNKAAADSLQKSLASNINDTLRMAAYRELALFYLDTNSDSAMYFIQKEIPLAKKLNIKLWEADALDLFGLISSNVGKYVQGLKAYNEALALVEDKKSEQNIWKIEKFTNSASPKLARLSMRATILSDMSGVYNVTEYYEKELSTIRQCIDIATPINDYTVLSLAYNKLGSIYLRNNQLDSALILLKKSLVYVEKTGYRKYEATIFNTIGEVYFIQKKYDSAKVNYFKGLASAEGNNNSAAIGNIYISLADFYNATGKYDSAIYYGRSILSVLLKTGRNASYINAYNVLGDAYKRLNKPDSALVYLQLAAVAKDSIFSAEKIKQLQNIGFDEQMRLQELEQESIQTTNRIRTYSLLAGLSIFLLVALLLYRNNLQKQKANKVLEKTLGDLKSTQSQLIQSEKMASLGELTAGIAHEIQNPLNFVNNFSEVSNELIDEMKEEFKNGDVDEGFAIADDIRQNLLKIHHHGKRASGIVKGMLEHSRTSDGKKEPTDLNVLADEYLRLAYHGLRAKDKSFNSDFKTDFDESLPKVNVIPQDIGRVLLNLINNAFYAVDKKATRHPDPELSEGEGSGAADNKSSKNNYRPEVVVSTRKLSNSIEICVKDNGDGIPAEIKDKIFQPFFTTKPTGSGTGLGLSLSYDIIKAHGGDLKVNSVQGQASEFLVTLPIS